MPHLRGSFIILKSSLINSTDPKPDERAGTVLKTDRAMGIAWGASPLRVRQIFTMSVWQSNPCTRLVNEPTSGQIRPPTPFHKPMMAP